jgi:hypothetical protein
MTVCRFVQLVNHSFLARILSYGKQLHQYNRTKYFFHLSTDEVSTIERVDPTEFVDPFSDSYRFLLTKNSGMEHDGRE